MGQKELKFSFDADFGNVDLMRGAIKGICREVFSQYLEEDSLMEFCMAATEALNNAVEHAGGAVVEGAFIHDQGDFSLRLITQGEEFDSTLKAQYPDADHEDGLPDGGYGLAIMQELVDELTHEYRAGENILTLKKKLIRNV